MPGKAREGGLLRTSALSGGVKDEPAPPVAGAILDAAGKAAASTDR